MCNSVYNHRLAPLHEHHLNEVVAQYPNQKDFAHKLFDVLTENLNPQVNLFVSFVVLKEMFDRGMKGIFGEFGNILYAPLSIVAKTGTHEWTRFRPQPVSELHTSFLSFMMAKPNRQKLNVLLGNYDLCFSQKHCCGLVFGAAHDVAQFEKTKLFATRNEMRSYAESMAMPVAENVTFEDIPYVTSDLGRAERFFYDLYEKTFAAMTPMSREEHIDTSKAAEWEAIVQKIPNESQLSTEAPVTV